MPNTMQELGAQIGGLFFNQNKGVAYRDQMDKNARSQKLMAEARDAQAMSMDRAAVTAESLGKAYPSLPPDQAAFLATVLRTQPTMNLNTTGLTPRQMQELGLQAQAQKALTPVLGEGNAALAAIDAKPVKVAVNDNNVLLNPLAPLGDQVPVVSPAFNASLAQKESDSKRRAQTSRTNAAARGGTGGKPKTRAQDEASVLRQARAAIAAGGDKEKVKERLEAQGYSKLAGAL